MLLIYYIRFLLCPYKIHLTAELKGTSHNQCRFGHGLSSDEVDFPRAGFVNKQTYCIWRDEHSVFFRNAVTVKWLKTFCGHNLNKETLSDLCLHVD